MTKRDLEIVPPDLDPPLSVKWALMRRAGYCRRAAVPFWRMVSLKKAAKS